MALPDDCGNALRVADILQRIGIQQNQISAFSGLDTTRQISKAEKISVALRSGPERFRRREPGVHKETQLLMQALSWNGPLGLEKAALIGACENLPTIPAHQGRQASVAGFGRRQQFRNKEAKC